MKYFKDNFKGYFQNSFGQIYSIYSSNHLTTIFKSKMRNEFNGEDLNLFYEFDGRKVGFDDTKMYIETLQLSDIENKWQVIDIDLPEPIERVTYVKNFMVLKGKENIYYYGKKIFSENYFPTKDVYGQFEKAPSTISFQEQDYKILDIQISVLFQVFLLEGNKALIKYKDEYYFKENIKKAYMFHSVLILLTDHNPLEFIVIGDAIDPESGVLKFYTPDEPLSLNLKQDGNIIRNKIIREIDKGNIKILFFPKSFLIRVKLENEYKYFGYGDFEYVTNSPFTYKLFRELRDVSYAFPTELSQTIDVASNDLMVVVDYKNDTIYTTI